MANLAVWQRTIVDPQGNVLPGAEVEVRHADTAELADIYLDRKGEQPAPNPIAANSDGFVRFYAPGGAYRVEANDGGLVAVWNFVAVGRLAERDVIEAEQFSSDAESHQEIRTKLNLVAASSEEMQAINAQVEAPEWAVAWADPEGNVAGGFDEQGRFVARIGQQVEQFEIDSDGRYVWAVADETGAVALGVDQEGITGVTGLEMLGGQVLSIEAPEIAFAVVDEQGRAAFAVYNDGTTSAGSGGAPITHQVLLAFAEPIDDPSEELFVTWLSTSQDAKVLEYRPRGGQAWMAASSVRTRPFPVLDDRWLHTVMLRSLAPDTVYDLRVPGSEYSDAVKTCPAMESLRITLASDWQRTGAVWYAPSSPFRVLGDISTSHEPDLLIFNGDFSNSDGKFTAPWAQDYINIFQLLHDHWRGRDGVMIPMISTMGNHEGSGPNGTGNAGAGGNGIPGMITEICSWSYTPFHESRFARSVAEVRVRDLVSLVCIETDHTVPLSSQIGWIDERLSEAKAAGVAHAFLVGHVPAFPMVFNRYVGPTPRYLRNQVWPMLESHASDGGPLRAYLTGHSHQAVITYPLRMDYDNNVGVVANDDRFYRDPAGIIQIGSGSVGASARPLVEMDRVSVIDGLTPFRAGIGTNDESDDYRTFGDVSNPLHPIYNFWVLDITPDGWSARCYNTEGDTFMSYGE